MPFKDPEVRKAKHREYSKKHYQKNKINIIKKSDVNKKIARAQWHKFKSDLSCAKCGQNHPATLDFHHVMKDPSNKKVNSLTKVGMYTAALEELKKCVVLCSNCHRIHHHEERYAILKRRKKKKALAKVTHTHYHTDNLTKEAHHGKSIEEPVKPVSGS
jgi:hypothetical protein